MGWPGDTTCTGSDVALEIPRTFSTLVAVLLTLARYKISSADIAFRCDATVDDLIDVIEEKSRRYIPVIYALNKIDMISIEELDLLDQ